VKRSTLLAMMTLGTGFASLVLWPTRTLAFANAETEEQRISRALQSALEKHGGDVNRCFEKALADTLDVAGKVELAVDVGEAGKVTRAVPLEHSANSPVLLACLSESATSWTIAGVAAGTTVIVPLSFEGQMAQFSIKTADAPERGPAAQKGKPKGGKPGAAPAFSVKVLVDEATMRARQASLSLLTVAPANRIAMHKHPGAEVLYIKKGRARVLGPSGVNPEVLPEGTAIFIPAGMPHVIENMVRTSPVEILQVFAPMGPERVYRDPTDEKGRAAFEVIRDASKAKVPQGMRFAVESFDKATVYPQGNKIKVHLLFEPASSDSDAIAMSIVEFEPGADVPRHTHTGSAEILYMLSGSGTVEIGSDKLAFGAEQAIHIPEGQPHAAKFTGPEKTVALQIYSPAGPEQRFKAGPAPGGSKAVGGGATKVPAVPAPKK
jgi:quercetin dioxygenase-like cupin family protein